MNRWRWWRYRNDHNDNDYILAEKKYNEDIEDFIIDADKDGKKNSQKLISWNSSLSYLPIRFCFYSSRVPRLTDGFIHTPVLYMLIFTKHEEAIWFDLPESLRFCWEKFSHYDSNLSFSISDAIHFILIYLYRFALLFVS